MSIRCNRPQQSRRLLTARKLSFAGAQVQVVLNDLIHAAYGTIVLSCKQTEAPGS